MDIDKKIEIITRNLQEVVDIEILKKIIQKRNINIYWGTATTGRPHIAYFLPIFKIKDFVDAECTVKILLADIHAFLDNLKAPISKIQSRSKYYRKLITLMLQSINVDLSKIEFVLGSSYQKTPEYFCDIMKILISTNTNDLKRAGSEVVKQVEDCKLSSIVYPVMQALDEEYLKVDVQFGGVDQRKIFMFSREFLPSIKYKKRIYLMNPMIPGLNSDKMSSSDKNSKIDLIDSYEEIEYKIEHNAKFEGLESIFKFIIEPYCKILNIELEKTNDINKMKKLAVKYINKIIEPIREGMLKEPKLIEEAYN